MLDFKRVYTENRYIHDLFTFFSRPYIGPNLKITSIISLVAGVVFLGFGIYQDVKSQKEK